MRQFVLWPSSRLDLESLRRDISGLLGAATRRKLASKSPLWSRSSSNATTQTAAAGLQEYMSPMKKGLDWLRFQTCALTWSPCWRQDVEHLQGFLCCEWEVFESQTIEFKRNYRTRWFASGQGIKQDFMHTAADESKSDFSNCFYRQKSFCPLQLLVCAVSMQPRSSRFCMAQTGARIYFVMVRKDVANHGQMKGLVHLVTTVLPSQLQFLSPRFWPMWRRVQMPPSDLWHSLPGPRIPGFWGLPFRWFYK